VIVVVLGDWVLDPRGLGLGVCFGLVGYNGPIASGLQSGDTGRGQRTILAPPDSIGMNFPCFFLC